MSAIIGGVFTFASIIEGLIHKGRNPTGDKSEALSIADLSTY